MAILIMGIFLLGRLVGTAWFYIKIMQAVCNPNSPKLIGRRRRILWSAAIYYAVFLILGFLSLNLFGREVYHSVYHPSMALSQSITQISMLLVLLPKRPGRKAGTWILICGSVLSILFSVTFFLTGFAAGDRWVVGFLAHGYRILSGFFRGMLPLLCIAFLSPPKR